MMCRIQITAMKSPPAAGLLRVGRFSGKRGSWLALASIQPDSGVDLQSIGDSLYSYLLH
jgi:hypothetical protein